MIRYSTGIKNRFSTVDMIIPRKTVVPTEWRPASPAPFAKTSGTTPRMKAKDVIRDRGLLFAGVNLHEGGSGGNAISGVWPDHTLVPTGKP
jgi:hypothetical protein